MKLDDNILNLIEIDSRNNKADFNVKCRKENNQYDISHKKHGLWKLSFIVNEEDKPEKIINNTNLISQQEYSINTKCDLYYKINNFIMNDLVSNIFETFNELEFYFRENFFNELNEMKNNETYKLGENLYIQRNEIDNTFFNKNMDISLTLSLNENYSILDSVSNLRKCIIKKI